MSATTGLGPFIKSRRELLKLTQVALGALVGVSGPAISDIERGETQFPNVGLRRALARELGVQAWELLVAAGEYDPVLDGVPPATPDAAPPDPVKARYLAMLAALRMDEAAVLVLEANLPALVRFQGRVPTPAAGMSDGGDGGPASATAGAPSPNGTPVPRRGA